jgi:hypothetical protein
MLEDEPSLPRGAPSKYLKSGWRYVAWAVQCVLPCTHLSTKGERILFKPLLKELLAEQGWYISLEAFFLEMCKHWNETHVILSPWSKSSKKGQEFKIIIFPKYVGHLVKHYKAWGVNQKKRVAMKVASDSAIVRAL